MPALELEVADAVLAALTANGATWPSQFVAERTFLPRIDTSDKTHQQLEQIRVFVVPMGATPRTESRTTDRIECVVDVSAHAYVERFSRKGEEVVELAAAFRDAFRTARLPLADERQAVVTARETLAVAVPEHLENYGVLTSVLRLTLVVFG